MNMPIITIAFSVAVLLFGWLIHVAYMRAMRRRGYGGVTIAEGAIISIATMPGLGGCASGWIGFAFPLPLIAGLPISLALIGNENCGWWSPTVFIKGEPDLAPPIFLFAWFVSNLVIIGVLYFSKVSSRRLRSRRMS